MALAVLKAALTFCIVAGHRQRRQSGDDISEFRITGQRPRKAFATADPVIEAPLPSTVTDGNAKCAGLE